MKIIENHWKSSKIIENIMKTAQKNIENHRKSSKIIQNYWPNHRKNYENHWKSSRRLGSAWGARDPRDRPGAPGAPGDAARGRRGLPGWALAEPGSSRGAPSGTWRGPRAHAGAWELIFIFTTCNWTDPENNPDRIWEISNGFRRCQDLNLKEIQCISKCPMHWNCNDRKKLTKGNRTRVPRVRVENPKQLDYSRICGWKSSLGVVFSALNLGGKPATRYSKPVALFVATGSNPQVIPKRSQRNPRVLIWCWKTSQPHIETCWKSYGFQRF